jgi:HEPN domain-containing protein
VNRIDLQRLSLARLSEAKALVAAGHPAGAYYLAGYAIECALKACIAKRTEQYDFPDKERVLGSWTHDFERLARCADLDALLNQRRARSEFDDSWNLVGRWDEGSRYDLVVTPKTAADFIAAIERAPDGVLPWIQSQW